MDAIDPTWAGIGAFLTWALLVLQIPATAVLLSRLVKGPSRIPPIAPARPDPQQVGAVTIVVPTLNEAARIGPCLAGLGRQSYEVRQILVVDSDSIDGTPDLVKAAGVLDPRFRLVVDEPLASGWIGRPWALHTGFRASDERSPWILGIDADTQPQPGLVAGAIAAAEAGGYDLVSLAPQFILCDPGELVLQPALLMTLVYRFGPSGSAADGAERVMANGQCFLVRRDCLVTLGGYVSARSSFCDDVTLARVAAARGFKVGFLDGARLLKVRMYEGAAETWREWGRSLDLKDAASPGQVVWDWLFLLAVQGLPLLILLILGSIALGWSSIDPAVIGRSPILTGLLWLNGVLVAIRWALNGAIAASYDLSQATTPWLFWLSPLADGLAVLRIGLSSVQTPTHWRGRQYS